MSCIAAASSAASSAAQSRPAPVPVHGVAYDALRKVPLPNAVVTLVGQQRHATTDDKGRFSFDSVAPGLHTFTMQHAVLDTVGLSGLSTRATITNGRDEVRIVLPSFDTLWQIACGRASPRDSGFVYGTVRDAATMRPVPNASVQLSWTELVMSRERRVVQRRWQTEAKSDSAGSYAVCGVAADQWLRIRAEHVSTASGWIDLSPSPLRVKRRDLVVGSRDPSARGVVVGMVTGPSGEVLPDARVRLEGGADTRTRDDGRFVLSNVELGTQQLEISFVGAVAVVHVVEVAPNDTAVVAIQLRPINTLEEMRVTAARTGRTLAAEFDARRKSGAGYAMDSLQIMRYHTFYEALQTFPSVQTERKRSSLAIAMRVGRAMCTPQIMIDGAEAGINHLLDLHPNEVAAIEVYNRVTSVPTKFVRGGTIPDCGMILAWTKYGFRMR